MPTVYLETSVISYLTARPSSQTIMAGQQESTRQWWERDRLHYDLYISAAVTQEITRGDKVAARERLEIVRGLPQLDVTPEVIRLAEEIMTAAQLPQKAEVDSIHLAVSAINGIDFLLTWNCRHIANPALYRLFERVFHAAGLQSPVICTPDVLLGDFDDGDEPNPR